MCGEGLNPGPTHKRLRGGGDGGPLRDGRSAAQYHAQSPPVSKKVRHDTHSLCCTHKHPHDAVTHSPTDVHLCCTAQDEDTSVHADTASVCTQPSSGFVHTRVASALVPSLLCRPSWLPTRLTSSTSRRRFPTWCLRNGTYGFWGITAFLFFLYLFLMFAFFPVGFFLVSG